MRSFLALTPGDEALSCTAVTFRSGFCLFSRMYRIVLFYRPGFLTIFASLHADGMVHLHDTDGEEVLAFDAGHGEALSQTAMFPAPTATTAGSSEETKSTAATAVVVGLTGDASEGDPVLVTAGADGTVRVHALTVRFRGKRVAGGGDGKETYRGRAGRDSRRREKSQTPPTTRVDGSNGKTKRSRNSKGVQDEDERDSHPDEPVVSPPVTAMGVGITVEFRVCLGRACGNGSRDEQPASAVSEGGAHVGPTDDGGPEVSAIPPRGAAATVTSMDAFYHRV